jgi:S-adenosylmethionine:tRNA ribosyltransferase-isomerase
VHTDDFEYELPEGLIAQHPAEKRDESRLLVVDRKTGRLEHRLFYNVLDYLNPGDCLVMNNSRVIPARLLGVKEMTGAKTEFLLTRRVRDDLWETMVRPGKKLHVGDRVTFPGEGRLSAEIMEHRQGGTRLVRFEYEGDFHELLARIGKMPLPPYIARESNAEDKERYQTVYCKEEGSVAAPTAGLHFTEELLENARRKGIKTAYVTLHVGIGTFRPVKCENIEDHKMHSEESEIGEETAALINETTAAGGRIVSVGTTSTRTLESAADSHGIVAAGRGGTEIFIYPGYRFKVVDDLITNFHLPKSTLLMLVSAFYNRKAILEAYQVAVEQKYRFFSYGDAMLMV